MNTLDDKPKRRGRPRNEKRYDEIMAVAERLFMQKGLRATTMEHIARELGISKLTLYSRFKNKDALFAAVIEAKCKYYVPQQLFGDVSPGSLQDSLSRIAYALIQLVISDEAVNMERMLLAEGKDKKDLIMLFYGAGHVKIKHMVAEYLRQLHEDKQLHITDPMRSAHLFGALIKGSDICLRYTLGIAPLPSQTEIKDYCSYAVQTFIAAHKRHG